jgi:hypothetical protein
MGERGCAGPEMLWCFVGKWVGEAKVGIHQNNLGNFLLLNPNFFFSASGPAQKAVLAPFFGVVFMPFFFPIFFFNTRKISGGGVFGS